MIQQNIVCTKPSSCSTGTWYRMILPMIFCATTKKKVTEIIEKKLDLGRMIPGKYLVRKK